MSTNVQAIRLRPIQQRLIGFTISGISPLIQHQWSEKARKAMRDKQAGKKTKNREARKKGQGPVASRHVGDAYPHADG